MTEEKTMAASTTQEASIVSVYVNSFTEDSAKSFFNDFKKAQDSDQKIVPVYIDSFGGHVDSLSVMIDVILSYPGEVATIVVGKAMSCGAILLACGNKGLRYSAPNARIMMHSFHHQAHGKVQDVEVDAVEVKRFQSHIFRIMAKRCGQPADYFLKALKKHSDTDVFMSPEEARKHKIIDHVKLPKITAELSMTITVK